MLLFLAAISFKYFLTHFFVSSFLWKPLTQLTCVHILKTIILNKVCVCLCVCVWVLGYIFSAKGWQNLLEKKGNLISFALGRIQERKAMLHNIIPRYFHLKIWTKEIPGYLEATGEKSRYLCASNLTDNEAPQGAVWQPPPKHAFRSCQLHLALLRKCTQLSLSLMIQRSHDSESQRRWRAVL